MTLEYCAVLLTGRPRSRLSPMSFILIPFKKDCRALSQSRGRIPNSGPGKKSDTFVAAAPVATMQTATCVNCGSSASGQAISYDPK